MEALGINLGYLIVQVINFIILLIILKAWVYNPIVKMLQNRQAKIAQGLEDARIASEARANAEEEAREIISKAQAEATQKVREASERAEAAAREIKAQSEADAAKARQIAQAEATQERDRILSELRGQVATLAIAAAQKLVGEALDEKRQHALLDAFFSGIKDGRVVVLQGGEYQGASVEITSALPLTEEEKETVRRDILVKIGSQTVTFRVDPAILGGLVIKVGDKVVDGSVAGQLESMRQSLV